MTDRKMRLVVSCFLALALLSGCSGGEKQAALYYCPMHPQVTKEGPGDCQICGMHLVPHEEVARVSPGKASGLYVCPMHPEVTSAEPADCSICGMHLVAKPVTEGRPSGGGMPERMAPIEVPDAKRAQLGLTFGTAERRRISQALQGPVRIVPDETRIHRVIARVDGYVDDLGVQYAGQGVKRGQVIVSISSPSIQATQQQFVGATPTEGRRYAVPAGKPAGAADTEEREDTFRQRLSYYGFGDAQIDRIQKTGKIENFLVVESPSTGVVTEKSAVLGQRVVPGDLLFVVTDLSRVWAEVEVSEQDVPSVRAGMPLEVRMEALPGQTFSGKVKFFQPVLDGATRTMKVYAEVSNPRLDLKPGMIGRAQLLSDAEECLAVPETSVLETGQSAYVFLEEGDQLVPRSVTLGRRGAGFREVLSGLKAGDRIATSATFLLDSESSLKAGLQAAAEGR